MSKRKPGKPTLSPAEVERVLAALRGALNSDRHRGNQSSLARALRVEPSAISQILSGKNQPSYETAKALGAHLGESFYQWLDPTPGSGEQKDAQSGAPQKPFYTRESWEQFMDPALETLIREGFSAAESRSALNGSIAFNTSTGAAPTLEDVLMIARAILRENSRNSTKLRKSKHI
jgi:transcriptional regulator with XRE-family HTH domain